jgi:hypothetical protein
MKKLIRRIVKRARWGLKRRERDRLFNALGVAGRSGRIELETAN